MFRLELPPDSRTDDVQRFFEQEAGSKVVDCRVMTGTILLCVVVLNDTLNYVLGFGFIEFETIEVRATVFPKLAPALILRMCRTPRMLFAWMVATLKVLQL